MSGPSDESLEEKEKLTRAAIASGIPQPGYRKSWDIPLKEGAMRARGSPGPDAVENLRTRKWPHVLATAFIAITVGAFLLLMPSTDPVTDRETPSGIVAGGATNGQNKLLAPGVRQDVLKFKLDLAVRARNHKQTIALITELRAAGSTIAGEVPFYEGRAYMALENWAGAYGAFVTYLNSVGRKGKNYKEAIALFVESERAIKTKRPSETDS
jgi:hypothetical protein